jgi:serine/threonine-protein kinase HipA
MKTELDVCLGKVGTPVGKLVFVRNGPRMFTQFAYFQNWLSHKDTFNVSPDLALTPLYQPRKPAAKEDSLFFLALGDTEPDAWGRRVIARGHAKRREEDPSLGALTELDYLCAVDDFSRMGALRLRNEHDAYQSPCPQAGLWAYGRHVRVSPARRSSLSRRIRARPQRPAQVAQKQESRRT